jgi:hypothetical protein
MPEVTIRVADDCSWAAVSEILHLLSLTDAADFRDPIRLYLSRQLLAQARQSLYQTTNACDRMISHVEGQQLLVSETVAITSDTTPPTPHEEIRTAEALADRVLTAEGRWRLDSAIRHVTRNRDCIKSLRDTHRGQRCFIIGNGPSLRQVDLSRLASEVTFGVNAIFLTNAWTSFRPTYYIVEDHLIAEDRAREINAYTATTKLFPWDQSTRLSNAVYLPWLTQYEPYPRFSDDIASVIYSGWTVTYLAIQMAAYMGIRDIILIGVDGTYQPGPATEQHGIMTSQGADTNHFHPDYYGPGLRFHPPSPERVGAAHRLAAEHIRGLGGRIRNATPGTALNAYERVPLSAVMTGAEQ